MISVKRKLLVLKDKHFLNESTDKSYLMLLINITCNESHYRVDKNRRDIAEKGWEPYNCTFLTFFQIRTTMTDSDYLKDIKYYIISSPSLLVSDISNDLFSDNLISSISGCSDSGSINLNTGLGPSVIDIIL